MSENEVISKQKWNALVQDGVTKALGTMLDGEFLPANYTAGFPCQIRENGIHKKEVLSALDTLVIEKDGICSLGDSYSSLYHEASKNIVYGYSEEDEKRMNDEKTELSNLYEDVIDAYMTSRLDNPPVPDPSMNYIVRRIKEETGCQYQDVDYYEYPDLAGLCSALNRYMQLAIETQKLEARWQDIMDHLAAANMHIKKPSRENGGLLLYDGGFNIGWDNLPRSTNLYESLKGDSSVEIVMTTKNFVNGRVTLNFANDVDDKGLLDKVLDFSWIFSLGGSHHDSYDLSAYAKRESVLDIRVKLAGLTLVPACPMKLSEDMKKGWHWRMALAEAAVKTGKDATGCKLGSGEFDPDLLFGEHGQLRRMKTMVLSRQPEITLTFKDFHEEKLKSAFKEETNLHFDILGGLISLSHENNFKVVGYYENSDNHEVKVSIKPDDIENTKMAFVVGGVPEYFER